MALALGRLVARESVPGERVGLLLPNLAPTLALVFGLGARRRVAVMLHHTAGVDGMQAACTRGADPDHRQLAGLRRDRPSWGTSWPPSRAFG